MPGNPALKPRRLHLMTQQPGGDNVIALSVFLSCGCSFVQCHSRTAQAATHRMTPQTSSAKSQTGIGDLHISGSRYAIVNRKGIAQMDQLLIERANVKFCVS